MAMNMSSGGGGGGGGMSGGGGGAMSAPAAMSNAMSAAPAAMSNAMSAAMSGRGMSNNPLATGMSVNPKEAPHTRGFDKELGAIRFASGKIARDQANATVDAAGRLSDQSLESTGDIAERLENSTYTDAAAQNITDAGASAAQLGQSYNQIGQTAERVAAYNNPVQDRLNQMALGQLYRPDQVSSQSVSADQVQGARVADVGRMQAAQVDSVANVGARGIQASGAERALMREATGGGIMGQLQQQASNDLALGRSLSAEQSRDATQSARAAAAARGLGVGQSAMATELLNRDRFATQREAERRGFASAITNQATGIQQAANQSYQGRMEGNRARDLQAQLANQQTGLQLGLTNAQLQQQAIANSYEASQQRAMADAGYAQQANLSNQDSNLRAAQFNSSQNLAAQGSNQAINYNANYANQNFLQGVANQDFNQFTSQQNMLGNLYGQQAGVAQNQYSNNLGLAQGNVALDPYQRALGSNIPIATQGNSANMIGQSFTNTTGYGQDLYNTNLNAHASIYNSSLNNAAYLEGARLQSDASTDAAKIQAGAAAKAGNSAMLGGIASGAGALLGGIAGSFIAPGVGTGIGASLGGSFGGAAGRACWVARAAWGEQNPRWVEFRNTMLAHAPEWFIAAYARHGESIASYINTPIRRAIARVILAALQRFWTPAETKLQPA